MAVMLVGGAELAAKESSAHGSSAKSEISYSPMAGKTYPNNVYFGDTHNHTANSGDAFMNGNRLGPDQAYRFARGEEIISNSGIPAKINRPLDFLVVATM